MIFTACLPGQESWWGWRLYETGGAPGWGEGKNQHPPSRWRYPCALTSKDTRGSSGVGCTRPMMWSGLRSAGLSVRRAGTISARASTMNSSVLGHRLARRGISRPGQNNACGVRAGLLPVAQIVIWVGAEGRAQDCEKKEVGEAWCQRLRPKFRLPAESVSCELYSLTSRSWTRSGSGGEGDFVSPVACPASAPGKNEWERDLDGLHRNAAVSCS